MPAQRDARTPGGELAQYGLVCRAQCTRHNWSIGVVGTSGALDGGLYWHAGRHQADVTALGGKCGAIGSCCVPLRHCSRSE
jgi:hypothetical protein